MRAEDIRTLLRKEPFEPLGLGLSDGRGVLVKHPDQVVVARRHVIVGIAQVRRSHGRLSTPRDGGAIAKDWKLIDRMHIVRVEPANGRDATPRAARRRS
jgi:hypothetical protein